MTLPELTFCAWDGDADERFTFRDMNRITYNANMVAREAGVTQVEFVVADRSQQFRLDEAQALDDLIQAIAFHLGVVIAAARTWTAGSGLSYADFERIEASLYACYQALGGIGDRIPAGRYKVIVSASLFPDSWAGSPPHIDLDVPMAHDDAELFAFVPHTATLAQRIEEMEARMTVAVAGSRVMRITATGTLPKNLIPIRIALGGLPMIENKTLSTAWSGNGPWTQDITLTEAPDNAVVGMAEGMTSEQTAAYAAAGIHVSAISGTTVTIRAAFEKPTIAIPVGVLYSTASVARCAPRPFPDSSPAGPTTTYPSATRC